MDGTTPCRGGYYPPATPDADGSRLNGKSFRNCPLASPGGKLLSVAKLMRGGDRLAQECSWMNGNCFSFHHSTYCCGDFKRSPPLISQPVPKCRLTAFPRGKPRTQKILANIIHRSTQLRGRRLRRSGRLRASPTDAAEIMGLYHPTNHPHSMILRCYYGKSIWKNRPSGHHRRHCRL